MIARVKLLPHKEAAGMMKIKEAASGFLASKRLRSSMCGCTVARVAGASRRRRPTVVGSGGIAVIDGGCPCMFDPTADAGHKAMRVLLTLNGNVPRQV
jgi:hypothetical protein